MAKAVEKSEEVTSVADRASDDVQDQARRQTGQRQMRLRVDEREMSTSYANAFRTNGTAEEVMVDFGCIWGHHTLTALRRPAGGRALPG